MDEVRIEGLEELERTWQNEALGAISDSFGRGVSRAVTEGADEAHRTHRYTDRTGKLTRKTQGKVELVVRGAARGVIEAKTDYASYVENGTSHSRPFPFMAQAYQKAERVLLAEIDVGIERARIIMER